MSGKWVRKEDHGGITAGNSCAEGIVAYAGSEAGTNKISAGRNTLSNEEGENAEETFIALITKTCHECYAIITHNLCALAFWTGRRIAADIYGRGGNITLKSCLTTKALCIRINQTRRSTPTGVKGMGYLPGQREHHKVYDNSPLLLLQNQRRWCPLQARGQWQS